MIRLSAFTEREPQSPELVYFAFEESKCNPRGGISHWEKLGYFG